MANEKLSSLKMTELPWVRIIEVDKGCRTHEGTAGVMLEGSGAPLPSLSRKVFSLLMILWVAIVKKNGNV